MPAESGTIGAMGLFDFFRSKKKQDFTAASMDQSFTPPEAKWGQHF